ncbi:VWA domain-containing protein [Candidatus Woesearchaeota archaeon]|nr:VWA domain-containing protein [Candidatus Woesearchaeota archaeon]
MTFSDPLYLTFLVSVPFFIVLHFLILKRMRARALKFANFEALQRVTGMQTMNKNITMLVLRLWAFIFLILAASGMVLWYTGEAAEHDYILAIDTSSSMLADDFLPTRLSAARQAAGFFLDNLPARTRVGLVTFSGTALARQLLTTDMALLNDAVDEIEPSRSTGTDLGNAIITSANLLLGAEKPRAVILLTDGQDTVGLSLDDAVRYADQNQIVVHTIGIGTEEGGSFIRSGLVSQLDEESLQDIAQGTGGTYTQAQSQRDLEDAYLAIATTTRQDVPVPLRMPLLLAALLILFTEWGLLNTRFRTLP